jgi:hypothetical protein
VTRPLPSDRLPSYRIAVAARVLGGVAGSYGVAAAIQIALARTLPLTPGEASVTATLIAVLAMPAAVIWTFAARSAARAWAGLLLVGGSAALLALLAGPQP